MHTKKVGSAGRFGNKYGSKIRVAVAKAEADSRASHPCPVCLNKRLIRKAAGIWTCLKCKVTIAGGAYSPTTAATKIMSGEIEALVEEPSVVAEAPKAIVAQKTKAAIHVAPKEAAPEATEEIKEEKPKKKAAGKKKEGAKAKPKKSAKKEE